ncbi:heterokaryon incompatibility protein-domain-containing protein [Hypomontagnella monticulosa]|nr:heterokaryon incompatibility protein-domain-containing protein [Hypomontagnella monticulosa]
MALPIANYTTENVAAEANAPIFCNCCNELISAMDGTWTPYDTLWERVVVDYHASQDDLYKAAESGCHICTKFQVRLRKGGYPPVDFFLGTPCTMLVAIRYYKQAKFRINIVLGCNPEKLSIFKLSVSPDTDLAYPNFYDLHSESRPGQAYQELEYTPPNSTDSIAAWKLCRMWMEDCIENHDRCKRLRYKAWWPTRLLYIGNINDGDLTGDNTGSLKVQLCLKQDQQPEGPYMTLSHCWGLSQEMLKLTRDTYEHRIKEGFFYAELPKTFQDAIRLCRFLGSKYIWIDSLCIIQGDMEDWKRESETMIDVYQHSECNIAATASQEPTEGCFYDRNPMVVSPLRITIKHRRYIIYDSSEWFHNIERAPLNKRAWVIQERFLAPRQVHCGKYQLYWECCQTTAFESFPKPVNWDEDLRQREFGHDLKCLKNLLSEMSKSTVDLSSREEEIAKMRHNLYAKWMRVLGSYSSCGLTQRSDKLVAISGISSQIQEVLGKTDNYLAGLWRSQLPRQLLWLTFSNPSVDEAPDYDIAPSWSWACLYGEIWYPFSVLDYDPLVEFLISILGVYDGQMDAVENTTGSVKGLAIRVQCFLFKLKIDKGRMSVDTSAGHHLELGKGYMDSAERQKSWGRAYIMPVMHTESLNALIVAPCQEKLGLYRRIGCWFSSSFGEMREMHVDFKKYVLSVGDEAKTTITLI